MAAMWKHSFHLLLRLSEIALELQSPLTSRTARTACRPLLGVENSILDNRDANHKSSKMVTEV